MLQFEQALGHNLVTSRGTWLVCTAQHLASIWQYRIHNRRYTSAHSSRIPAYVTPSHYIAAGSRACLARLGV